MTDLSDVGLDTAQNSPIFKEKERTPPAGASNTNRGLTSQAESGSVAASQNPISATSSRQLLSPAVDGFFIGKVRYCRPSDDVIRDFVQLVCERLNEQQPDRPITVEVRQGFRQFLDVLINIETKYANRTRGNEDEEEAS